MKNSMMLDDGMPVVLGNCIRVENVEKTLGGLRLADEPDALFCVQVESENGEDEYPILVTPGELAALPRAKSMDMKKMVAGRIYPKFVDDRNYYCVRLRSAEDGEFVGMFDIGLWKDCFLRAVEHPKSCTKKGVIRNILD